MSFDMPASDFRPVSHQVLWHNGAKTWHVRLVFQNVLKAVAILKILTGQCILQFYTHLTCVLDIVVPKKSLRTISLCRQDGIMNYIPKFQDATISLEVAEIRFSNLVL